MAKRIQGPGERRWTGGSDAVRSGLVHGLRIRLPGLDWTTSMADLHGKVLTLEYLAAPGQPLVCVDDFYSTQEGDSQLQPVLNLYEHGIMDGAVPATPQEVERERAV